jgi:hypothetical protein
VEKKKIKETERKISKAKIKEVTSKKNKATKTKQKTENYSSSDESLLDFDLQESSDSNEDDSNAECLGCGEPYSNTSKSDDWIKCINCENGSMKAALSKFV